MADTVNKTRLVAKTAKLRSTKLVSPPEPQKLGNYTLTTRLGSGGMGSVYRAHDDKLDRTVAIKVMLSKYSDTPEVMTSFRREAQAAAKLNHPNIAQIYSFGEDNGRPYIAMEYVSGDHFDKLIQREEPLDQAMVMKIGMDIAGGLAVAADASLIHGDIKPENIVFDDHGVPKLLDFGIALASNAKTTEIWGTPYYIAPEKLKKQRIDFRSDIYCLGGTLYHALTKHPPFDGDDVKEVVKARLINPPKPLSVFRPDIDPEVEAIILRMLQAEPADRYPTYGALLNDIRKYLRRVRPQMIPVTTEMLFVTTQFIADAAAEKAALKPKTKDAKAQTQSEKQGKKHLFSDFKSQLLLLLTLVAFFPYFIIFYSGMRSLTTPAGAMPGHPENTPAEPLPQQEGKIEAREPERPEPRVQSQMAISNEQIAIPSPPPAVPEQAVVISREPASTTTAPEQAVAKSREPAAPAAAAQPSPQLEPSPDTAGAMPAGSENSALAGATPGHPENTPEEMHSRQAVKAGGVSEAPAATSLVAAAVISQPPASLPASPEQVALISQPPASTPAVPEQAVVISRGPAAPAEVAQPSHQLEPKPAAAAQPSPKSEPGHNGPIELPPIYEGPRQNWPELKVTATMGSGNNGNALVNGDVVSVGFSMQNGVTLTAVGSHFAEFCYKGEYKRVVVTAPPKKQVGANGKKGRK